MKCQACNRDLLPGEVFCSLKCQETHARWFEYSDPIPLETYVEVNRVSETQLKLLEVLERATDRAGSGYLNSRDPRVQALETEGLIEKCGQDYRITALGRAVRNSDYESCGECGYDHAYEPEESFQAHERSS